MWRYSITMAFVWVWAAAASAQPFLVIPNNSTDRIQKFDPQNGNPMGQFVGLPPAIGTQVDVALGPGGYVYATDIEIDRVERYTWDGSYVGVFLGGLGVVTDPRGIDFWGDRAYVAKAGNPSVVGYRLYDGAAVASVPGNISAMDVHFLPDGSFLVSTSQSPASIRHYGPSGASYATVISSALGWAPQQIQRGHASDRFLVAASGLNRVYEFDLASNITRSFAFASPRGVYPLGNGNVLVTKRNGVYEVDPTLGHVVSQKATGSFQYIELLPEPGTMALLGVGGLLIRRRRWDSRH